VSPKVNRLEAVVRGKGKKGAQVAMPDSTLAIVETEDGVTYHVKSHVRGKIVEVNERLVNDPDLVRTDPCGAGYVAMVLPKVPDGLDELKQRLVGEVRGQTEQEET
jgi:glycine cleavage system H lipoate-binding protein